MNNQDAKFYLSAYRPSGDDARDPAMADALEQARRDPGLREWFEREQAHDGAVSAKLKSITPPADLRTTILAGARASGPNRVPWQQSRWAALAAMLVMVGTIVTLLVRTPSATGGSGGLVDVAGYALRDLAGSHVGGFPTEQSDLAKRLSGEQPLLAKGLDMTPEQLREQGCHTLKVGGHDVFEVCFKRDQYYHLYLVRRSDARVEQGDEHPILVSKLSKAALSWADERYVYVLAGEGDGQNLRALL